MERSSTDFPAPEPPTTPSTSPRMTSRSMWSWMSFPPIRLTSPRTRIATLSSEGGGRLGLVRITMSDTQERKQHGKTRVHHDHQKHRFHDRARGQLADAAGVAFYAEAFEAAHHGNEDCKNRRLDQAQPERPLTRGDGVVQLAQIDRHGDAK